MRTQPIIRMLGAPEETSPPAALIEEFETAIALYGFESYLLMHHVRTGEAGATALAGKRLTFPATTPTAGLPDPVLQHLRTARSGFRIRDALSVTKRARKPRGETAPAASATYWSEGYAFPVHTGRGFAGSLALGGQAVLAPLDLALFEAAARLLFRKLADRGSGLPAAPISLTRRESEVLDCLAAGLTSNEIGKTMKISAHTVDWYMNGLQDKFEARNRHHLVALAFRMGMIG